MSSLLPHTLPALVRLGVWIYTGEAAIGTLLGLVALVDGIANLRVVWRAQGRLRPAAWLWVGLALSALLSQAKLAVIGALAVSGPTSGRVGPYTIPLVTAFILVAAVVLGVQILSILGRSALRHS